MEPATTGSVAVTLRLAAFDAACGFMEPATTGSVGRSRKLTCNRNRPASFQACR
jgi:hypothetical protein